MEITDIFRDQRGEIIKTMRREAPESFDVRIPTAATTAPDGPALLTVHIAVAVRDGFIEEASIQRNDICVRGLTDDQAIRLKRFGHTAILTPAR